MKIPGGIPALAAAASLAILLIGGVGAPASAQNPVPAGMVDEGSWYTRESWPHDGRPYESPNFTVFSDAAGPDARRAVASLAEEVLAELLAEFGVTDDAALRLPPRQGKIHIYAYRNRFPQNWGARAYYAGLIIWSLDHTQRDTSLEPYRRVLKHELVHVVEALLKGRDVRYVPVSTRVPVWFSEGFAEVVAGGTLKPVRERGYLEHLTSKYGKLSPVSFLHDGMVGDWSRVETVRACSEYHYPMYRLAVEYLIDERGFGKSIPELVGIFTDMASGTDFSTAFVRQVGVTIPEYEARFFDLMDDYLPESDRSRIEAAAWVWLLLVAVSLAILVRRHARGAGTRRRPGPARVFQTVVFGPLGLADRGRGRALRASLRAATGNAVGLIVLFACFPHLAPGGDPKDLAIPAAFVTGWLLFRAPHAAAETGRPYPAAALRTLLAEFLSTILVLAGMLTLLIQLSDRFWWIPLDPGSLLFWPVLSAGAVAGAAIVYPLNLWTSRRAAGHGTGPAPA